MEKSQDSDVLHIPEKNLRTWGLREIINQSDIERKALDAEARLVEEQLIPLKDAEVLNYDKLADISCGIYGQDDEWRPVPDRHYSTILNQLPIEMRSKWSDIYKFLIHDIAHIGHYQLRMHAEQIYYRLQRESFFAREAVDFPPEWDAFYREVFAEYQDLFAQNYYPHQFARAVAELELGREVSEIENIDLNKLVHVIARSLQVRQVFDDYVLATPDTRQPERNEIILNLSESSLETNPGMIWSIIFNLMKNATKELSCEQREKRKDGKPILEIERRGLEGKLPENPIKLYVKTEELADSDLTLIHVADSGKGLQLDEIMNSLKELIEKEMLHETDLKGRVKRIVESWQDNPFAIRALRLGEILDMAGVARLSGFVTRDRLKSESSGMGLWGAEYLSSKMGGEIIYTNTADGGAMFTVIIPNHYLQESAGGTGKRQIRSTVRSVRKAIEAGEISIDIAA